MTPIKSLMRPYFSGFWLLAVSLALVWAGSAAATITLSVDKPLIREEDGRTEITVTAESDAKVTANTVVSLKLGAKFLGSGAQNLLPNGVGNIYPGRTIDEHGRIVLTHPLGNYVSPNAPWWAYVQANDFRGSIESNHRPGGIGKTGSIVAPLSIAASPSRCRR